MGLFWGYIGTIREVFRVYVVSRKNGKEDGSNYTVIGNMWVGFRVQGWSPIMESHLDKNMHCSV